MNAEEILKKLEEIKVDAMNNLSSSEEESKLQVESATEELLDEDAAGEDTKKEPLDEKVKDPYFDKLRALSRVTPMDGAESPPENIYLSGEKKAITTESIQVQLDDLKKTLDGSEILKVKIVTDREGNKMKITDYTIPRTRPELDEMERNGLITVDTHPHMGMGHQVWGAPNGKWYCLAHGVRIPKPQHIGD